MPIDPARLASYLARIGAAEPSKRAPSERLAEMVFAEEIGRPLDDGSRAALIELVEQDLTLHDARERLHQAMERSMRRLDTLGTQTESFRRLSAHADLEGRQVSPQVVSECIAAYRSLLGREPDEHGFDHFVELREREGLGGAVAALVGSAEAGRYFDPGDRPGLSEAILAVSTTATVVLAAAGTDVTLAVSGDVRAKVDAISMRLDGLERSIALLADVLQLRLDASGAS